jgi:two-component system, OmpR family, heavy metal sensor histidine kinase CusS
MIRSLRLRLLIGTSLATAMVLSLLGVGIYYSMRQTLMSDFDEALLTQARALASMTEQEHNHVTFEFDAEEMPDFAAKNDPEFFEIWIDDDGVLGKSDSLGTGDLPRPALGPEAAFHDADLPDGRQGRWVTLRFTPPVEDTTIPETAPLRTGVLTVARNTRVLGRTLDRLRWLLLGLCAAATIVCGSVLLIVVSGAMHPVRRLAREIEALVETDLAHRFDATGVPSELAPIVERLNGLLERLYGAFGRERAFAADVAHELRTPLAGLRTTLEVCRSRQRDAATYESAMDKCISITERMQEMVQRLLLLARADARQLTVRSEPVELRKLLEDCWSHFRSRAEQRDLHMQLCPGAPFWVDSDESLLRIVVDNLLDNAVTYADEGGNISVATRSDDHFVELLLSNSGSQVDAADAPRVFDRFWRGDAARSQTGVHSGLGLSLCERLMRILNGNLFVQTERGGLFVVRLRLAARAAEAVKRPAMGD